MKGLGLAVLGLMLAAVTPAATAQDVQSIAAIVNDEVVSVYDVERRLKFLISTSQLNATSEVRKALRRQVLDNLINERLQLQEAERLNLLVTEDDIESALRFLARQNNVEPDEIDTFFRTNNVDRSTLIEQLRAEIAWTKVVNRRLRTSFRISDEEIDEALEFMEQSKGQTEILMSEIFLPVDVPEQEDELRLTAERLAGDIRNGTPFGVVARQYSQGVTAHSGGDVGWIQSGQLAAEIGQAIAIMDPGQVSPPIRTADGYYIVGLRDTRKILTADRDDVKMALKQIVLPLTANAGQDEQAAQHELATTIRSTIGDCGDVDRIARDLNSPDSGDLGTIRLGELPANFRAAVENLSVDQASVPVVTDSGVHVLVVCERTEPNVGLPDRRAVENRLLRVRLAVMARRYLHNLRRDAVVEFR